MTQTQTQTQQDMLQFRNALRDKALNMRPEVCTVDFLGEKVEIRQPSLQEVMEFQSTAEGRTSITAAEMIIRYVYIPGTDMHLFEPGDAEVIAGLPLNAEIRRIQEAINKLTDVELEVQDAEKNSETAQ